MQERFDRLQQAASSDDNYGIKRHVQYGMLQVGVCTAVAHVMCCILHPNVVYALAEASTILYL